MRGSMGNPPLVSGTQYRDRVRHIPDKFNILADRLSRLDRPLQTEWALDQLDIVIRVRHIPDKLNILADCFLRLDRPLKTEWLWINRWRIPFSKCSIIPMWICLRHGSITNSHCMYLQFWTIMP